MSEVYIISGPDASGKSTQIERLRCYFEEQGEEVNTVWLRHKHLISLVPLLISRILGCTIDEEISGYSYQYHRFSDHPYLGFLYTVCLLFDLSIAYLLFVYIPTARGKVVICDRGPLDTLIDLRFKLDVDYRRTRLDRVFRSLPPRGSKNVILCTEAEELKNRRNRLRFERDFDERVECYNSEADRIGIHLIDTNTDQEAVFDELVSSLHIC